MSQVHYLHAFAVVLAVAACGGGSREPAKPASPPPAAPAGAAAPADFVPMCKRLFARKATCADDYLPALLDVRVELNMPPGIGEKIKTEGRDAVLVTAHEEFARDSEPARVAAVCEEGAARAAKAPPERVDQLLDQGTKCEASADCKAFAVCAAAIDRGFIAAAAQRRAAAPGQR
ncbi:MAG TPA: hypothetical protein VL326_26440 [Kofleriaceae bacterium]|nr:hypothetical protein [Kofleriaceae bacterium]